MERHEKEKEIDRKLLGAEENIYGRAKVKGANRKTNAKNKNKRPAEYNNRH